jgi:hypothetical protein
MTLAAFLQRIVSILDEARVPYMLTGSIATAYYAVPRATQDVDLVLEVDPEQLRRLTERISAAGYYVSLEAAQEALAREGQFNAIDPASGWKADFIVRKSRAFNRTEFGRRASTTILGLDVAMVTREDLIVAKLEYIEHRVSELGLEEQWESAGPD